MFAGPNGSGKSTLKTLLPPELLGVYLNPDEIEAQIRQKGIVNLEDFGVVNSPNLDASILNFFHHSDFLKSQGFSSAAEQLSVANGKLDFSRIEMNSYFASVTTDCLRRQLLKQRTSFTFETVMSSRDKVTLLEEAQELGYRTYLYFIATDDPLINISRVRNRVKQGGHSVPEDKVVARYTRSLELLTDAICRTNRAYIFDNSSHNQDRTWLAEITDGQALEIKADQIPAWFTNAVLKKFQRYS
jgi:predicted ABC-type ATPase